MRCTHGHESLAGTAWTVADGAVWIDAEYAISLGLVPLICYACSEPVILTPNMASLGWNCARCDAPSEDPEDTVDQDAIDQP